MMIRGFMHSFGVFVHIWSLCSAAFAWFIHDFRVFIVDLHRYMSLDISVQFTHFTYGSLAKPASPFFTVGTKFLLRPHTSQGSFTSA